MQRHKYISLCCAGHVSPVEGIVLCGRISVAYAAPDAELDMMTMARCFFELKLCGLSHPPMKSLLGRKRCIAVPMTYEMTVKKMTDTETLYGLKRKLVASGEPKPESPACFLIRIYCRMAHEMRRYLGRTS